LRSLSLGLRAGTEYGGAEMSSDETSGLRV